MLKEKAQIQSEIAKGFVVIQPDAQNSEHAFLEAIDSIESNSSLNSDIIAEKPEYKDLQPLADKKSRIDLQLIKTGLFTRNNKPPRNTPD